MLVDQLGPGLEVAVLLREVQHVAERLAARDDRDLVRAVDAGQQLGAERVAGLVEGDHAALVLGQRAARLHAGDDALERAVEVGLHELARGAPRAAEIAASLAMLARSAPVEPGGLARDHAEVDVLQRLVARVDLQDRLAPADVRRRDEDLAVEAAGPQQRRIELVEQVRGRDHDELAGAWRSRPSRPAAG